MSLEDALKTLATSIRAIREQCANDTQSLENALNNLEERMGQLEGKVKNLGLSDNALMGDISKSLDSIDGGVKGINRKLKNIDGGIKGTNDKLDNMTEILLDIRDRLDSLSFSLSLSC